MQFNLLKFPTKVVITAGGIGTRLLPATLRQPKELLPVFYRTAGGELLVKPILQLIFEQLFESGFRQFYFIVGKKKRSIQDHFTINYDFIEALNAQGKSIYAKELTTFYEKLSSSQLIWIDQADPLGFGHAVLSAKDFIKDEPFLVHAGDTSLLSKTTSYVQNLVETHNQLSSLSTFLVTEVKNPLSFGVITGREGSNNVIYIESIVEKPKKPKSNLIILPIYIFERSIFGSLENISPGINNEIQLTDGIVNLLESNKNKVLAIRMNKTDLFIDVGDPETYWESLKSTYRSIPP
jgi:UTP--glucose-1-phosphate uridylyltransferase